MFEPQLLAKFSVAMCRACCARSLSLAQPPQLHGLVLAARREPLAVGTDGDRPDVVRVRFQLLLQRAVADAPEADGRAVAPPFARAGDLLPERVDVAVLAAAADEELPVGREGDVVDVIRSAELAHDRAVAHAPDADDRVVAAARD